MPISKIHTTPNSKLHYKYQTNTLPHPYPKYIRTTHPVNITKLHPSFYASLQILTVIKHLHLLNSHQIHDAVTQSTPYPPTSTYNTKNGFLFPQITYITEITLLTAYMVDKSDTHASFGSG